MSRKLPHLSVFAAIFALCLMVAAPAYAHHSESHTQGGSDAPAQGGSDNGSRDTTKGNDRKSGYDDDSKTPQETNHGKGSDRDGDADSDSSTSYTEHNDTNDGGTKNNVSDDGDNRHPSGKDRSVENGGSGTQGKSESNPDDSKGPMRYETSTGQGDDKPNGPGGTDLADQDGNNGCGNDDDFDDDNNGWCGRPPETKASKRPVTADDEVKAVIITKTCPNGAVMPVNESCSSDAPELTTNPVLPELATNPAQPDQDVLGTRIERDAQPAAPSVLGVRLSPALSEPVAVAGAVLPFTGGELLVFLAAALGLIAAGAVALKLRSNDA